MAIDAGVFFLWALLVLVLPLKWLMAAGLSIAVHELCHILALCWVGKPPLKLRIGLLGCTLDSGPLEPWQEVLCALAGPLGSFSLLFLARGFPRMALCALFHGGFNLLPVYPLDGGRVLNALAGQLLSPPLARLVCDGTKYTVLVLLALLLLRLKLAIVPVYGALVLAARYLAGKIPCKAYDLGVQ